MSMSVSLVKRFSVLACVLMLPLGLLGPFMLWLVDLPIGLFFTWLFLPLIILALLIVGGVCGRPRLTLTLCGMGLALFLCYAVTVCTAIYAVNSGLIQMPVWVD